MCRYEQNKTLAGILYFHRISDFKMTGISMKNLRMFRKLCGDNALRNVVIVTNMWGEVNPEVGKRRETELRGNFFKPLLDMGARMIRHENTLPSAERIIRLILGNHPLPLRIQEELVKEKKIISETGAGEELNRAIKAQIDKHQEEMRMFRDEMTQAMKDKDEEVKRRLDVEMKGLEKKVESLQKDRDKLSSDHEWHISRLRATIQALERDKAQMREGINQLTTQVHLYRSHILKISQGLDPLLKALSRIVGMLSPSLTAN